MIEMIERFEKLLIFTINIWKEKVIEYSRKLLFNNNFTVVAIVLLTDDNMNRNLAQNDGLLSFSCSLLSSNNRSIYSLNI